MAGNSSGRTETPAIPDVDAPPMPALAPPGVILDGNKVEGFEVDQSRGYPDVRSFRRKFGLLVPATNTGMEHELWEIVFRNHEPDALRGVGLHATNIVTPRPVLATAADLEGYREQILSGAKATTEVALLAKPRRLIMGMSLEHVLCGIGPIRAAMAEVAERSGGVPWAT